VPTQGTSRAIGGKRLRRGLIALWCFVAVGCAGTANAPTNDALATAEPTVAPATPPAAEAAATSESDPVEVVAALPDSTENVSEVPSVTAEPEQAPPAVSPAEIATEVSELAVVAPAAAATEAIEPALSLSPSLAAAPASAEALDFSSLVTRLRKTKAINLRTKVAVKNESDDLLEQVRAYHAKTGETTLADLRRAYDSLFQELHALLEDADPPLARDIDRSRAAIWEILADPRKFNAAI